MIQLLIHCAVAVAILLHILAPVKASPVSADSLSGVPQSGAEEGYFEMSTNSQGVVFTAAMSIDNYFEICSVLNKEGGTIVTCLIHHESKESAVLPLRQTIRFA